MATAARDRVLVVDDDARLLVALKRALALEGFDVATAADAGEALALIEQGWQDVIILDVMMPVLDGIRFCRLIRDRVESPILMLTALDGVSDRVSGLQAGADDYLSKPFATDELVARLRALLRRSRRSAPSVPADEVLVFADLRLDIQRWLTFRDERRLSLTSTEFRILRILIGEPGRIFSRGEIITEVWGERNAAESNNVDVHVAGLRQKLEADGGSRLIQTVRGVGYVLKE